MNFKPEYFLDEATDKIEAIDFLKWINFVFFVQDLPGWNNASAYAFMFKLIRAGFRSIDDYINQPGDNIPALPASVVAEWGAFWIANKDEEIAIWGRRKPE